MKVWDAATGIENFSFDAGVRQFGVAFAPEASLKYLASAGEDGYVRIWNLQTRELARARLDHAASDADKVTVRSLSFAPSGSGEFVTAGFDGRVRFYRLTGAIDAREAYARKALRVAWSPDGARIVSAGSGADPETVGRADRKRALPGRPQGLRGFRRLVRRRPPHRYRRRRPRQIRQSLGCRQWPPAREFRGSSGGRGGGGVLSRRQQTHLGQRSHHPRWDIGERRQLLTAIGFGDQGFVTFTPEGCFSGSNGIEAHLSIFDGRRYQPISSDARKVMYEPAGFASLLAR